MRKLHANAFEIGYPEGWDDHSTITMIGPLEVQFSPNVQVNQEKLPSGQSAADFFSAQRAEMAKDLELFRLLDHGERSLGGERAVYHMYTWRIPQGVQIRQLQVATIRNDKLYTVTCSAKEASWDGVDAAFDMIIAGFRFREAVAATPA
ncbi:MAG: DcrB-related protein [Thermoleophilia bacterium]|nr:DcrB-related protein [Thermoleophilia bacterium]